MLQVALANEISVSELAAAWMPSTQEVDVKIALARQAGDEAGHFQLVADRDDFGGAQALVLERDVIGALFGK